MSYNCTVSHLSGNTSYTTDRRLSSCHLVDDLWRRPRQFSFLKTISSEALSIAFLAILVSRLVSTVQSGLILASTSLSVINHKQFVPSQIYISQIPLDEFLSWILFAFYVLPVCLNIYISFPERSSAVMHK